MGSGDKLLGHTLYWTNIPSMGEWGEGVIKLTP